MPVVTREPGTVAGIVEIGDLLRPDAFAHPAQNIRMVETHISWIILAGDFAYKLRKPVDFGFLDFSTLAKRRADCEAEVALNRRLCADLYLGVVDVVRRHDGRLAFDAAGTPIEPAVQMRRLPEAGMLPNLIARQECDERLIKRMAERLAEFHAEAATGPGVDEFGSLSSLRSNWDENFRQTPDDVLEPARRGTIQAYVERFLTDNAPLLQARITTGRIRDGHGDLHAGSVCSARRRLYLFDCVEFNARFRCADVAAEVAFLAMDLEHLGRADLAETFVDGYVRFSGDAELRPLLNFYKCYRAFVRGKVIAFRLGESRLDAPSKAALRETARAYFDLACTYANPQPRPLLIVTMGLPSSGKSTIARGLASRLALIHLSSDVARKQLVGLRATVHRADAFEGGLYSRGMTRRTYAVLRRKAARWLRRGRSVVLDATYGHPTERGTVRQVARRAGATLYFVLCRADEAVLRARLAARASDPMSTSDARPELWPALRAAFVEPREVTIAFEADTTQPTAELLERMIRDIFSTTIPVAEQHAA